MKLLRGRQSGQTLIMALILLALGSLLVVPLLNQSFTNLGYHQSIECRTLNSYAADSGVEYALCKVYGNPGIYTETPLQESFTLNNRTVNVTANYTDSGRFIVTSTASGGGCGSTTIITQVNLSAGSFAYAVAAKNYMSLDNAQVDSAPDEGDGDIHSNGNIDLLGSKVVVNGDASAVGAITGKESVTGLVVEGASPIKFPGDYAGLYETMAKEGDTHTEDMVINEDRYLGPVYIDGNLTVEANTTVILEGTVYVTGAITVNNGRFEGEENVVAEGGITINGGGVGAPNVPLFLAVNSNITVAGGVADAVLYAPDGTVTLTNFLLFGAAGGDTVIISKGSVTYASALQGREDLPGGLLSTITYGYD